MGHEGGLVAVLADDLGSQIGGVGLDQHPLLRHARGGSRELAGARVGDVAGERDPVAPPQALLELLGHREAVHHDLHPVGFGGQLLERLAGRLPGVDDQRLAELRGQRDLGGEGALLVAVGGVVAVEVQARLADRQAAVVGRQRPQLGEVGVVEAAGGVGVPADRGVDLGEVLGRGQRRAAGGAVDADREDARHAGLLGRRHELGVGRLAEVEVGV